MSSTTTPGFDGTEHSETGPASAEWLTGPAAPKPTPPPRKPWHKRTWVRVIAGLVGVTTIIGIIGTAASGASHPAAAPAKPKATASAPAQPTGFAQVRGLVTALKQHGVACTPDAISKAGAPAIPGGLAGVDCSADTVIVVFKDHASAVAYAQSMLNVGQGLNSPTAEVVGSNWTVNTVPAFAAQAVKVLGGQLMSEPAPVPSAPASQAPAAPATTAPAAPATSAPAAPAGPTASQQQALDAAQNYLSDGQGFSRAGLIQQLTSQYGNGFSQADATWAVDNSGADWDAQAVISAKNYMSDGQGFSRDSLIAQLDSPYGSQFTYAQAVYAAGQVGL
jgi:hypothetical protein